MKIRSGVQMDTVQLVNLNGVLAGKGIYTNIFYRETEIDAHRHRYDESHVHSCCELYFNVSADVSFTVGDKLYRVDVNEILMTKPNEFHNCVYHSDGVYKYYCLWLAADKEFASYLAPILERDGHLIRLDEQHIPLFKHALKVLDTEQQAGRLSSLESATAVFDILQMLSQNQDGVTGAVALPQTLSDMLAYINANFSHACTVGQICDEFFISRSTVNRLFRQYLHTTPAKYVENRRLSSAKVLLEQGESVQQACEQSGFPDYSHFIALFKKRFGITPYQYAKQHISYQ